jgi:hypothetical protein
MITSKEKYLALVIEALEAYQFAEFYSDRELSVKA